MSQRLKLILMVKVRQLGCHNSRPVMVSKLSELCITHTPADVQLSSEVIFLDVQLLLILQQTVNILHLYHYIVRNIQLIADVQLSHLQKNRKEF